MFEVQIMDWTKVFSASNDDSFPIKFFIHINVGVEGLKIE